MRIGLIISQLRNGGGAYQLLHLAQELQKARHDVIIYTLFDTISNVEPQLVKGLTIKSCHFTGVVEKRPHSSIIGFMLYVFYFLKTNYLLSKLIAKDELDLLNPHEWPVHWSAVFVKWRKRVPVVWMCNDVWHIPDYKQYSETRIVFRIGDRLVIGPIDRVLTFFVDAIAVLDRRITAITQKYYRKKPIVVRSGVDLNKFKTLPSRGTARNRLDLPKEAFLFLCLSIFFPHRRFEDTIVAFQKVKGKTKSKNIKLIIAGSDAYDKAYAKEIRRLVSESKIGKDIIIKTEYMGDDMVRDYLIACDTFVFPNEKQTWGLTVAEAMAAGKPCIVSNEAGVHEIIEHGKNGLVFKVRDIDDLVTNMERIIKDASLRRQLGKNAREYVFGNLSWGHYASHMLYVYENCVLS